MTRLKAAFYVIWVIESYRCPGLDFQFYVHSVGKASANSTRKEWLALDSHKAVSSKLPVLIDRKKSLLHPLF